MKATEMLTEAIIEELRCCILDLDTMIEYPANARLPSVQRRMLELTEELKMRVESLMGDIKDRPPRKGVRDEAK